MKKFLLILLLPFLAFAQDTIVDPPPPPPDEVIELKIELLPNVPLDVGVGDAPPPAPTVIGYACAVTVIPAGAFLGLAG